jgi:uncharacterized damage-inducible protein DinB
MTENMQGNVRTGAVGAILDEYELVIAALKAVIAPISDAALVTVVDPDTVDPNCKSIQAVLAHVVRSGYTYAIVINSSKGPMAPMRDRVYRKRAADFMTDLDAMFAFNVASLSQFQDAELEEYDMDKKLLVPWGQRYDIEQLMEHAIVHILRHRRQIERFLRILQAEA